jgi:hypothetical protein
MRRLGRPVRQGRMGVQAGMGSVVGPGRLLRRDSVVSVCRLWGRHRRPQRERVVQGGVVQSAMAAEMGAAARSWIMAQAASLVEAQAVGWAERPVRSASRA